MRMDFLLLVLCFFTTLFAPGRCIDCFRCNSTTLDCSEKFFLPNPLKSESCADVFEARYCVKTIGIYNGILGTQRFCSAEDLGNYCEIITHGDDRRQVRSCVYTCYSDGCNAAPALSRSPAALLLMSAAAAAAVSKFLLVFR